MRSLKDGAPVTWACNESSERKGRANLFKGAVMAHRNPLAHRELKTNAVDALSEFLLLNHLYKLEADAIASTAPEKSTDAAV